MCLATALTPGFRGFDLMRQRGTCPMGMRWAASSDMSEELSHIWIDQFTYWDSGGARGLPRDLRGRRGRRLCQVRRRAARRPEEPVYRIVKSDLPKLISKNQMMKLGFERAATARIRDGLRRDGHGAGHAPRASRARRPSSKRERSRPWRC
jgi:sulfur oxygenase/reductase